MPVVSLTSTVVFSPITGTSSTTHNGLMVWNNSTSTANGLTGEGFYFWENHPTTAGAGNWYRLTTTGDEVIPTGTVTHTTLRWNGTTWVENQGLLSDGSTTTSLTTELLVGNNATVTGTLAVSDNATITGALVVENNATVTGTLAVTGNTTVTGDVVVEGSTTLSTTTLGAVLQDYEGDNGAAGQVLSSTGTSTNWNDFSLDSLTDTDSDTKIQVEEGADEDTIRFDTAGTERMIIDSSGNVGIGTSSPSEALTVNGQKVRLIHNATGGSAGEENNVNTDLYIGGTSSTSSGYFTGGRTFFTGYEGSINGTVYGFEGSGNRIIGIKAGSYIATSTTGMFISNTGNVGINTKSPTNTLTVSGTAQVTGQLYDSSGDAGTAGQVLSTTGTSTNWVSISTDSLTDADGDTQIQVEEGSDDDTIRFDTAGTERMVINNTGNVGIGMTPLSSMSLGVSGTIYSGETSTLSGQNNNVKLLINNATTQTNSPGASHGSIAWVGHNRNISSNLAAEIETVYGAFDDTGELVFKTSNDANNPLDRMRISQHGNVGIGTTSPTQTLTVSGTAQVTGQLYDSSGDAGTNGQVLSSTGTQTNWISISTDSITDADGDTQIQVEEGTDEDMIRFDTAGTERMLIDSSGNVGIGTSTPTAVLHVSTSGQELAAASYNDVTSIPNDGTWTTLIADVTTVDNITPLTLSFDPVSFNTPPTFNFSSANTNGTGIVEADGTVLRDNLKSSYWFYDQDDTYIKVLRVEFQLNGNALEVREQAARYRTGSSVPAANRTNAYFSGAGWTTGGYRLDLVRVSSQAISYITNTAIAVNSTGLGVGTDSPTHTLTVSGTAKITGAVQLSNYGAGAVQSDANGNLSVSSDERLKTVVGSFERGLKEILQLKPINYQWNAQSGLDPEGVYSGFSAQNVQAVIPEAVGQDQKGYLTLSDRPIIGALVNAIKALKTENDQLKKQVKSFLLRLEKLEKESLDNIP